MSTESLMKMLSVIRYRGPDESGIYSGEGVCLGNVRLSIIDISSGKQPLSNSKGTKWIVYNGEVFNYIELRASLQAEGVKFQTESDTEVVLKYYEKFGEKCLDYFNGQFAFAIWDNETKELFLGRDRMGIRPLYYYADDEHIIFGSEIKSILSTGLTERRINTAALQEVFTFWTTLSPDTCFENVKELPPGHFMKIKNNKIEIEKYWSLSFPTSDTEYITDENEAARQLDDLLLDAVKIRLRADVQVAAYLSGGLDSSATTYYIKKIAAEQLKTFSIGFSEKQFDESEYQKEVSDFLDTRHTSFNCSNSDIAEHFANVVYHTEIPILRTAPTPMYLLSKNVRKNDIKVVITGEGADEILGGYNIFKEMYIRRFWARYPNSMYRPLLLKKLYPFIPQLQNQSGKMLKFFFGYRLTETASPLYSHLLRWNNSSKITSYLNEDIQSEINTNKPFSKLQAMLPENFALFSDLAKAQWLESSIFMSGYLLSSQGDRMAMANSVEGRYPFLDFRVVEFCSRLHPDLKLKGLNEKYLLKKIMNNRIPQSVIKRSKQAYRAPISTSFMNEKHIDFVMDTLSYEAIRRVGLFNSKLVSGLLSKLRKNGGSEMENMAFSAILSTQLLYDQFIHKHSFKSLNMSDCRVITS